LGKPEKEGLKKMKTITCSAVTPEKRDRLVALGAKYIIPPTAGLPCGWQIDEENERLAREIIAEEAAVTVSPTITAVRRIGSDWDESRTTGTAYYEVEIIHGGPQKIKLADMELHYRGGSRGMAGPTPLAGLYEQAKKMCEIEEAKGSLRAGQRIFVG
jgi:hypothetical protein